MRRFIRKIYVAPSQGYYSFDNRP